MILGESWKMLEWNLQLLFSIQSHNYRPQRSCEGYVFTGVCLSTGGVGVSVSVHAGIHPPGADTLPGADTPPEQTPPRGADTSPRSRHPPPPRDTATAADGTHPTGMHSCFNLQTCNCTVFIPDRCTTQSTRNVKSGDVSS